MLTSSTTLYAISPQHPKLSDSIPFVRLKYPLVPRQNIKCSNSTCQACPLLASCSHIRAFYTQRVSLIDTSLNCLKENVTYALQCCPCGKQHVDSITRCMRIQIPKLKLLTRYAIHPMVQHLNQAHKVYSLEVRLYMYILCKGSSIEDKEYWMSKLHTVSPNGLNPPS